MLSEHAVMSCRRIVLPYEAVVRCFHVVLLQLLLQLSVSCAA